jgi:ATP-binding cassette subfamily F protein uup
LPALNAQHLRKSFGPQTVLDDATFTLARGEKVALIGANGAGKSTLARIIAGVETPDGGTVSVRRGLSIRYLAQEPELDPARSALEVVEDALVAWRKATARHAEVTALLSAEQATPDTDALLHEQAELDDAITRLGGWERGHQAKDFLHKLGVGEVDRPCGERSGGERRRIALAQLLMASPDIAILDEPTNHLDADTAEWLEEYLASEFPGAIVLVTHDRYFLDSIAERVIELERGTLTAYAGNYGDYLEKKAELMAHEERVEQNRQNMLRREREWLSRGPKARGTKQKARIQRAHALEAEKPANAGRPGDVALAPAAMSRQGKTILELAGLVLASPATGEPLNAPFDLILSSTDRIGIVGPNGVGKTTLMRAILSEALYVRTGERDPSAPRILSGRVVVGKNTRVAYLDQARAELDDTKSIFDDVRGESGSTVVNLGIKGSEALDLRSYLEMFLFDPYKQRQKVGSLSGGERARVALAKVLREGANLLMFDEPTNDLDLPTLASLETMLETYPGSVLVVTHDRAFLDHVATAILAFERTGEAGPSTVQRHAGGYEEYATYRRSRLEAAKASPASVASPATRAPSTKGKGGLTYAERLELEGILEKIEAVDRAALGASEALADPSLYATRGHEVAGLQERLAAARAESARLVLRWEALERKKMEG